MSSNFTYHHSYFYLPFLIHLFMCSLILTNIFEYLLCVRLHWTVLKSGDIKNQTVLILGEIIVYCIDG